MVEVRHDTRAKAARPKLLQHPQGSGCQMPGLRAAEVAEKLIEALVEVGKTGRRTDGVERRMHEIFPPEPLESSDALGALPREDHWRLASKGDTKGMFELLGTSNDAVLTSDA